MLNDLEVFRRKKPVASPANVHPAFATLANMTIKLQTTSVANGTPVPLRELLMEVIKATYDVIKPEWCKMVADVSEHIVSTGHVIPTT